MSTTILVGDCRQRLAELPAESVQMCVTSPPYFGLRDYGTAQWEGGDPECDHAEKNARNDVTPERLAERAAQFQTGQGTGSHVSRMQYRDVCGKCGAIRQDSQIGLEPTVDSYVAELVAVFREVRRVLRPDGVLFLNLGDSYAAGGTGGAPSAKSTLSRHGENGRSPYLDALGANTSRRPTDGLKPKDLIGVPWRVAFALQADGWWLRQDIIWSKPNPMPESVTDRCTKSHEYLFLLTKSARYYWDAAAIAEPVTPSTVERLSQPTIASQNGSDRVPGKTNGNMKAVGPRFGGHKYGDADDPEHRTKSGNVYEGNGKRNKRSVWTIATQPYKDAHFATFPPALVEPCILAGSRVGDTVLDPFGGSGTTAEVATRLGRHSIIVELNPEYVGMIRRRTAQQSLFAQEVAG
jgi:DNA modification methylase